VLSAEQFYTDSEIQWFGPRGGLPDWLDPGAKSFACLIREDAQHSLCLMFNAGLEGVDLALPPLLPGARWYRAADTAAESPHDLFAAGDEPPCADTAFYRLEPRASAILLGR
jgi:glycogen operon protein